MEPSQTAGHGITSSEVRKQYQIQECSGVNNVLKAVIVYKVNIKINAKKCEIKVTRF